MSSENFATMTSEELLAQKLKRFENLNHYRRDNELHWLGRAKVSEEIGEYAEAVKYCSRGITRAPSNGLLYVERGRLSMLQGEYSEAAADLARSIDLYNGEWSAWYHYGIIQYILRDYANAEEAFADALDAAATPGAEAMSAYWMWITLQKLGDKKAAAELVAEWENDTDSLEEETAKSCAAVLALAKGQGEAAEVLGGVVDNGEASMTRLYGVYIAYRYGEKNAAKAAEILERMLAANADSSLYTLAFRAALGEK